MLDDATDAPDFDDPLGLLRACHGRVERFAELAGTIGDHLAPEAAPDPSVQRAAGRVLRYFEQAAPLHHADEEQDLLPRLRPRLPAERARALDELLAGLEQEHHALERHWQHLRPQLQALARGERVDPVAYRERAEAFRSLQLDHLERENRHLLPAAEAHLEPADRAELGRAMARRRGLGQNGEE